MVWITIWQILKKGSFCHQCVPVPLGLVASVSPWGWGCPIGVGDIPVTLGLVASVSYWGWGHPCPIGVGDITVPLCVSLSPSPGPAHGATSRRCVPSVPCPLCPMSPQGPVLCHKGHIPCPQPFLLVPCPSWGHCLSLVPHTQLGVSHSGLWGCPLPMSPSSGSVPRPRQCPQGCHLSPGVSLVPVSPQGTTRRTT